MLCLLPMYHPMLITHLSTLAVHEQPATSNLLLGPRSKVLPGTLLGTSEDKLGLQRPLERNVPNLAGLLVRKRVVVLQVGSETFGFQCGPGGVLVHGGGVLGPGRELVGVLGELGLEVLDGLGVFVEEDLGGRVLVG